ncbi:MAG: hypothetical protein HYY92_02615 [Parcubacteria group bacterium]|nr:hypothetical protein [Parcubacteria group bacterium]
MIQALSVVAVALVVALSVMGTRYLQEKAQASALKASNLDYYEKTMLREQGWSQEVGNYDLRSFDGGKRWYAVESDEKGGMIIRGVAEDIFPGLLGRLRGMEALSAYVKENGPLTFSGPRATVDRALIEAAGFSVAEEK